MENKVLLTIDFINDLVHPNGKLARCQDFMIKHKVIAKLNTAISWARANKVPVIHIKTAFLPNYADCPRNSPIFSKIPQIGGLMAGEWGTEIFAEVDQQSSDSIVTKRRLSALRYTELEPILQRNDIKTLLIAGSITNMAVESTARDAHDRDYRIVVLSDACGAICDETQQASLNALSKIVDIKQVGNL